MTELFDKIKEITELDGIAGYEHKIRDFFRQKMTPFVDEVETDGLGGLFGIKHSKLERAPRVMVAGILWLLVHNASPFIHALNRRFLLFQVLSHHIFYVVITAELLYPRSKILFLMAVLLIKQKLKALA